MTGKERVLKSLEFQKPDQIPIDLWILPAAKMKYGKELEDLCSRYERDIISIAGPFDHGFTPEYFQEGKYMDPWGCEWENIQAGLIGEVKKPVFAKEENIIGYEPPVKQFWDEWELNKAALEDQIHKAREKGSFVIGGWISLFERMQYLRGTEDIYCDLGLEEEHLHDIIAYVMEFERAYLDAWLEMDIDAVTFGDDWGSQISLLISLECWKTYFKPLYKELIDRIKAAGKKVFFHSDGYILQLYPEFIELGVDAVNSQLWCMGVEKVAQQFAGKITFWGEISRQTTLPSGTPEEIRECANAMKNHLYVNGGGLIGQSEINKDVALENIEAVLTAWN